MINESAFSALGVAEFLGEKLDELHFVKPTAVQAGIIPLALQKKSVLFQSETGTGKTLAYLLPLLQNYCFDSDSRVQIIIAAPTHELASQIKKTASDVGNVKTILCIGSAPIRRQIDMLSEKPAIVVGTPARLVELIHLKKLKIGGVRALALDETDRLLSPELRTETEALLSLVLRNNPAQSENLDAVQILACSATVHPKNRGFFESRIPAIETVILPNEDVLTRKIEHQALFAEDRDKTDTLRKYLAAEKPRRALIFTSGAHQAESIAERLKFKNVECGVLHAKSGKMERKQAIDRFRSGKCALLITSDLSARGLDIQGVTHIVQMDFPFDAANHANADFFIHRAGRTGRAGASGINIVIGDEYELTSYAKLEKKLGIIVYPKMLYGGNVVSANAPE